MDQMRAYFAGEAAKRIGVSRSTLSRWEAEGIIPPARRRRSYRVYSEADIERIKQIVFEQPIQEEVEAAT